MHHNWTSEKDLLQKNKDAPCEWLYTHEDYAKAFEKDIREALHNPNIKSFREMDEKLDQPGGSTSYSFSEHRLQDHTSHGNYGAAKFGDIVVNIDMCWESR